MGLFLDETNDREGHVLSLYGLYKSRRFCSSTPTLFNSGTPHSQLSSCYLYHIDDTLESIMQRGIAENAYLAKWAGGLGGSWTSVRGTGAHIAGHQRRIAGRHPVPEAAQRPARRRQPGRQAQGLRLRLPRDLAQRPLRLPRAAPQHRRRPPPHARHEHGELDSRPVHEAAWKRASTGRSSAPPRSPDLHHLYGRKFEERYAFYEQLADEGKIWGQKVEAIEVWKKMLSMLFETGHPWITFKDPCNVRVAAGPRRRHPLLEPLHRDHAQHRRRRDRRVQSRQRHPRLASACPTAPSTSTSCARPSASPCARSTTSSTSTSTRPRPRGRPTAATVPLASA